MKLIASLFIALTATSVLASPQFDQLASEYQSLYEWTQSVQPDGLIGYHYPYKQMDGYMVIWEPQSSMEDGHVMIRIFLKREAPLKDFAVIYYKSRYIMKGRTILRRFYGPDGKGWRNDTVDFITEEYLGSQGNPSPSLKEDEQSILDFWKILPLESGVL